MRSLAHAATRYEITARNGSKTNTTGRAFAAQVARVTSHTDAELWLVAGDQDQELAADLSELTGVDAELWEQRSGEAREVYLDRAATAILDTNPETAEVGSELEFAVAQAEAIVTSEAARYRLLFEAVKMETEQFEAIERAEAARARRAAGVEKRLSRAAAAAAEFEELDRTAGEPDDPTWSAAELRGIQRHSPFRNGSAVYRFRRSNGTLAPEVA